MRKADRIVGEIVADLDRLFGDGKTAFIVMSDHGFGRQTTHDEYTRDTRRAPLVVWGAGLSCRNASATFADVRHKDLSVLVSMLVGNSPPAHSRGSVPDKLLCMASGELSFAASATLTTCQHALAQLLAVADRASESDRLLRWAMKSDEARLTKTSLDQLMIILENKPEFAADILAMGQRVKAELDGKIDALLGRNRAIAMALGTVALASAAVGCAAIGFGDGGLQGNDSAVYLAILLATVSSLALLARGVGAEYYLWTWAAAIAAAFSLPLVLSEPATADLPSLVLLSSTVLQLPDCVGSVALPHGRPVPRHPRSLLVPGENGQVEREAALARCACLAVDAGSVCMRGDPQCGRRARTGCQGGGNGHRKRTDRVGGAHHRPSTPRLSCSHAFC